MAKEEKVGITNLDKIKNKKQYKSAVGSARSAVFFILTLSFIVFVAIAIYAIWSEGLTTFVKTIESVNLGYFLLSLAIIFFSYAMRFPKWSLYLQKLGVHIPIGRNFVIYLSMYSMDITPGRWGRAIVSYTINNLAKVKFAVTFPAVVADIFTDFLGFAIITDVTALILNRFVVLSFIITILLIIPFLFVYIQQPYEYVKKKYLKFRNRFKFLRRLDLVASTADVYFVHNKKLGWKPFLFSMALTIPSMFLNGMALYVIIEAFGVHLGTGDIVTILFIFSSSLVLGMITGIPGTLGVTDAALVSQLQIFFPGIIDVGMASAITIMFRIASVWFVEIFGFAALLYTLRYWKDK